jgi:hypothetical protein
MTYGQWLIDSATRMCQPATRYELSKRTGIAESHLSAVANGKRPFPPAWAIKLASVAGVDAGEAVLRAHAERADAKKPPLRVAGFAQVLFLGYVIAAAILVGEMPKSLKQATAWLDSIRIVSRRLNFRFIRGAVSVLVCQVGLPRLSMRQASACQLAP